MEDKIEFTGVGEDGLLSVSVAPQYKCPRCGYEGGEYINVEMVGYEGRYCLQCYAKWISENMPRLELKSGK